MPSFPQTFSPSYTLNSYQCFSEIEGSTSSPQYACTHYNKYLQFLHSRAQQQEQRILREKIQQEIDPGNPYWELIKMIR